MQYTSHLYTRLLPENYLQISMSEVGQVWQNGYTERLMRTDKEEDQDFDHALLNIKTFIESVCNTKRIHSSLGYLTPAEFEADWHIKEGADYDRAVGGLNLGAQYSL